MLYGSSPRVRGTGPSPIMLNGVKRFIPTRVGNRHSPSRRKRQCSVHPHACGEQRLCRYERFTMFGSSPRVWGTDRCSFSRAPPRRFIPTRVGNSPASPRACSPRTVHPHACGEQVNPMAGRARCRGSSPRMWGTVRLRQDDVVDGRFIPTRVGNSISGRGESSSVGVHPHACGEQPVSPPRPT